MALVQRPRARMTSLRATLDRDTDIAMESFGASCLISYHHKICTVTKFLPSFPSRLQLGCRVTDKITCNRPSLHQETGHTKIHTATHNGWIEYKVKRKRNIIKPYPRQIFLENHLHNTTQAYIESGAPFITYDRFNMW